MIFLDTSAIYALADTGDDMHEKALQAFDAAMHAEEEILVHSYVLVESAALLQRRLGLDIALAFLKESTSFAVVWADDDLHSAGVEYLRKAGISSLSLVDAVSFVVMRKMGVTAYLGFDKHFSDTGFVPYESSR